MQTDKMEAPENAWYTFQNGHFEIIPEKEGNTLDTDAMLTAVEKAVSESQAELSAEDCGVYAQPEVRSGQRGIECRS
jgi:hypothetical protein